MANCPLCCNHGKLIKTLSASYIRSAHSAYYAEEVPEVGWCDYSQWRCSHCTLEFFTPALAGSSAFYQWISHQPGYYPTGRWEWDKTFDLLEHRKDVRIFEIGCGNGDFLKQASKRGFHHCLGIDTNRSAVEVCQARGYDAYCGTIEQFLLEHPGEAGTFDVVVSYHCLEHVTDPLLFTQQALALLKPRGQLLFSTPYSPMSFETNWYDPLNHPPHHLTRWNLRSYEQLALSTETMLEVYSPQPNSMLQRVLFAFYTGKTGTFGAISKKRLVKLLLAQPNELLKEWGLQKRRERIGNQTVADVILVQLRKSEHE